MSSIVLTKDNFVSQLPELYDLVMKQKEVIVEDQNDEQRYEVAMNDFNEGKNTVDHNAFTALMQQRWIKIK